MRRFLYGTSWIGMMSMNMDGVPLYDSYTPANEYLPDWYDEYEYERWYDDADEEEYFYFTDALEIKLRVAYFNPRPPSSPARINLM